MNSHPEALSDWNILAEDLDCEKNPFLQMSQDEIQKLDAVLSSEQARALLRETSNDRLFSDPDKLDDVLNTGGGAHGVEENKLPAVLEETLGVSFKDLEHLVLGTSASSELFPEAAVGEMPSDILDIESQLRSISLAVWLDHSYALHLPQSPVAAPVAIAPEPAASEVRPDPPVAVICEALPQNEPQPEVAVPLTPTTEPGFTSDAAEPSVPSKTTSYQSDNEQKDDDSEASGRPGPRRRSQRQIEKTTREQVEKIRAENAEMERKEREEMERKVSETVDSIDESEGLSEMEAVASELSKPEEKEDLETPKPVSQEITPQSTDQGLKPKDEVVVKRKRKKSHKSESDASDVVSKGKGTAESLTERPKSESSPKSKSPKVDKEGKNKRNRTHSSSVSPSKKLNEDAAETIKSSKEKSPSLEKKKKKVKKEKSYSEDPEPALFSFPDKMIKGSNDISPDVKPQRKPSTTENPEPDIKKTEVPSVPTTPPVKTEVKPEVFYKKEVEQNLAQPDKVVKTESVPAVPAPPKQVHDSEKAKTTHIAKSIPIKKVAENPGKVVKRSSSSDLKLKKHPEITKSSQNSDSSKLSPNNGKLMTDKPKPMTPALKTVKPNVKPNSDQNVTAKEKLKSEILKKSSHVSKSPATKASAVKSVHKTKEKSSENHKSDSKNENKSLKKKTQEEEARNQKNRERRTIKKKNLDPNEIHPNDVSDPEDYSDDPNDSDWGSEDDPEKLWCICKQPSNDRFMIQCDPCSNWFHGTCVGVSRQEGRQMERDGVEWHCPQCVKNANQGKAAVIEELPKPKPVKKEVEVKPKHSVKSTASTTVSANQCIVCKSRSKSDSVYCGEACIEQHAKEVLKLLSNSEPKTDSKEGASLNVALTTARVVVMERWTGKLYTGPNAPTQESLMAWLKANPTFEALKPGPAATSSGNSSSSSANSSSKKAKTTEKEEKPAETTKKVDPEPVRLNVRKTLKEILIARCKDAEDVKIPEDVIAGISLKIEEELYKLFKDTNSKYKSKYRSLMFNVKDPRNQGLFRKIVNRKIPPQQLVRMSPEELASRELAKWRERENQHAIEMIKKDQLENRQMQSLIIKKTHKGEVEIEDDNLSSLKKSNEDKPETPEEDLSDIKAMLADTTNEHRTHLFDVNCQICTGRKAISELEAEKSSPEKRKIKVARTISMEQPIDPSSKEGTVVITTKVGHPVGGGKDADGHEVKEKKKHKKKLVVIDEPSDLEPTSTVSFGSPGPEVKVKNVSLKTIGKPSVWKGFIFMLDVTKFVTSAHKVSGPTSSLSQEIPDTVQVCGRIPPDEVWSYLSKIKQGGTKELIVMRFQPANEEEKGPYEAFFNYLNSRKRYGVVRNSSKMIKDFYIIPLGSHSPVPTVLMPFDGPGLDSSRPNLLLGVIVRHKYKAKLPPPAPPANPAPEKYEHPERSYTPPLDALPCQSTTVDSSISTSGTSAVPASVSARAPTPNPTKTLSPVLSPTAGLASPTNIPGILSPSTLIPSSLIASILAPKISALKNESASDITKAQAATDDEPYEPSYTPPLENASKLDEDKPYDPDDLDNLDVQTKANVRSYLDTPSPVVTNPELEAQKKLLAELTRQVEEQKEQIEMQKTQVLAAAKSRELSLDNSDILLPEMLQSILKNIQAKSGQPNDGQSGSTSQADSLLNESHNVKSTSLSNMSAKELVERAQRELADLPPRAGADIDRPPPPKKIKHIHNPIPTIGDSTGVTFSQGRTNLKAEPPPPGVDVEELVTDYDTQSYHPTSTAYQEPNPYPSLGPTFQQPYYPPPHPRDRFHQGPAPPVVQQPQHPPPPPPPPPPPHQQQWVSSNRETAPWPVNPPDPFFQSGSWNGPWNQPPPPVGWNGMPPWNPHGQDIDARDSDLRVYQRRNDRHYNRDRNRQ